MIGGRSEGRPVVNPEYKPNNSSGLGARSEEQHTISAKYESDDGEGIKAISGEQHKISTECESNRFRGDLQNYGHCAGDTYKLEPNGDKVACGRSEEQFRLSANYENREPNKVRGVSEE